MESAKESDNSKVSMSGAQPRGQGPAQQLAKSLVAVPAAGFCIHEQTSHKKKI